MNDRISLFFEGHQKAFTCVQSDLSEKLPQMAEALIDCLRAGHKILVMGNGGSAADAQHFAAELVGRFSGERRALPAIALTTDTSILTAVANDFGFDEIFKRQVQALAAPGDVVLAISTSGNSNNVYRGLLEARNTGCKTVALLGGDGGRIAEMVDEPLVVSVPETPHIQEMHAMILHLLCRLIDDAFIHGGDTE
ncbi:MAG: D-sedoheptulose 7-phosphate isomerase [Geoalkalibacter sp.]|jgi:D-sedoheptulose 7-phosphate isomerase|uniref:D-sedoheptulose 7-phosphate isomerase n=1 Tax=Geoalkalibacter sp. TaxID=3041440 RepID=UPI003D0A4BBA